MFPKTLDTVEHIPQESRVSPALSADQATRKANGYLVMEVGMFFGAKDPVFLPLTRPVWQVMVYFQMYDVGPLNVGFLDVDAITGQVIPLPVDQIETMLDKADAFVICYSPATATAL